MKWNIDKLLIYIFIFVPFVFVAERCLAAQYDTSQTFNKEERQNLVRLFENTTFKKRVIQELFFDSRLKKMPIIVNRNVKNKEIKANYADFLSKYSIYLANQFAKKWRTMLARASRKFGVDSEVLVAVLLVETGFGNVLGRYSIVSVYSSIIIEHLRQQKQCALRNMTGCLDSTASHRLQKKAKWAEKELKALVEIAINSKRSLFRFKGSYAGAFGIPQFLPSSYLKWGYDSDKNGSVNLFLFPDAIYSTANYLKAHGWQKGLHHKSNQTVVWKYNHSQIYVDTIFKVAKKVKVYPPKNKLNNTRKAEPRVTLNAAKKRFKNPS
ncbi:MAG: lytic murein transglycosylase [Deltaproteobacteria bacterium]|nr:lytic murein transglycosylase [Deltaproteobacteria bacterium]MBT4266281.1 lytic murein transglycosylase [Deltaproteobacteria bacterium]MBT4639991.1 lytic murein transglycosylase [Deltaproteobacteria bacterium]MBT6503823.1 lytic murein transglycosylase [Deltaproteobacteria bacterium]MBT6615833.1 lytic murein transglycosylase [Deltaproteobacteria bacterium]